VGVCQLHDQDEAGGAWPALTAPDSSASTHAQRDEQIERERAALAASLRELIDAAKQREDFAEVKLIEALFYAQLRNQRIAHLLKLDEKRIALVKHRWLRQLGAQVQQRMGGAGEVEALEGAAADSLLTEVWEQHRLSCPKRSTVGGYVLGTLNPAWQDYVEFHVNQLGCRFCRANLADLRQQNESQPRVLRDRIVESTVGFLRPSAG
jgi:hypothetical protein